MVSGFGGSAELLSVIQPPTGRPVCVLAGARVTAERGERPCAVSVPGDCVL